MRLVWDGAKVVGKVTGNERTDLEGKTKKAAGKAQSTVGKATDDVRNTMKK